MTELFAIDRLTPGDLGPALRLSTQAGWNQTEGDWRRLLELAPEGCLAGRQNGQLVATATVASFGASPHWIGMVLVDASLRGRGLGSRMFSRSLEVARTLGGGTVGLDASDLGRPVYLKQGFADVAAIDRWSGLLRGSGGSPDAVWADPSWVDEISVLDLACCGTDRRALFRHLLEEPGVSCAVVRRGELSGFAFLRPGRASAHLGPIVALEKADLTALLCRAAEGAQSTPVLVDAIRTPETTAAFERCGLSVSRRLTRMTLGLPVEVLMGPAVRAAVSFEWG